ncbi:MAG: hypothetical protein IPG59_17030 [Candidatus Melainabacteria bacterium]|nr:MAG: hypothetical protein IPG59_17030 [Candidatus Melainabacteria bacterium]
MSEIELNEIRIAAPCKVPWDSMKGTDTKRYCSQCHLNVYNISNMTAPEAVKLIGSDTAYCFSLYRRPDGTVITRDCPIGVAKLKRYLKWSAAILGSFLTGSVLFHQFMQKEAEEEFRRQTIYNESCFEMGAKLQAKGKVVICAKSIPPGVNLSEDMFEEIELSQEKIPMDSLTSISLIEGKLSKIAFQKGDIVSQHNMMDSNPRMYRLRLDKKTEEQVSQIAFVQSKSVSHLLTGWIKDKLR